MRYLKVVPTTLQPDPLEHLADWIAFLEGVFDENGCLIIAGEDPAVHDAVMHKIGKVSSEICVHTLETARYLQNSKSRTSYTKIDPTSRIETVAIHCAGEVWAYGDGSRAEALGTLLYLLYMQNKADESFICQIANEHEADTKKIVEVFNMYCAPLHRTAPTITITPNHH